MHSHTDVVTKESDSESLNSTFEFDDPEWIDPPTHDPASSPLRDIIEQNNDFQQSTSSSSESESDINDSGLEVWDEIDDSSADSEVETTDTLQDSQLTYLVSLFLSFFQLCFHVSDKALSLLLSFISALLRHIFFQLPDNLHTSFIKAFPSTLYSLRKNVILKKSHISYVVCQRCHKLYTESDCVLVRDANRLEFSPKCDHMNFLAILSKLAEKNVEQTCLKESKWVSHTNTFPTHSMFITALSIQFNVYFQDQDLQLCVRNGEIISKMFLQDT